MGKILLSLPDELLKDLDEYCGFVHMERSEFLRMLIRDKIYLYNASGETKKIEVLKSIEATSKQEGFRKMIEEKSGENDVGTNPFLPEDYKKKLEEAETAKKYVDDLVDAGLLPQENKTTNQTTDTTTRQFPELAGQEVFLVTDEKGDAYLDVNNPQTSPVAIGQEVIIGGKVIKQSNAFQLCKKHKVYKNSCGCV